MTDPPPRFDVQLELGRLADRLTNGAGPDEPGPVPPGHGRAEQEPLASSEFAALLALARHERVTGLLAHAVSTDCLPVTDEQFALVAEAHLASMSIALVLEQMLCRVHVLLAEEGVDHVVLKGPAVAHTAYPDPSLREFGDLDLLVPAEQVDRAVRLLVAKGARRQLAPLAPGWDRLFAKSMTMTDPSGYEIDLHRSIAPGVFGLRIDPAHLLAHTQPFTVGGHRLRGLSPEGQLLQACLHTAAGNRRVWLSSVCDIVQLTRSGRADLEIFRALVDRWEVNAVVERAVRIAGERLGGADVSVLMDHVHVTRADRRRLDHYGAGFSGPALTGFSGLPVAHWPKYARALVWPARANLRDRGLTRSMHLRRLASYLPGRGPTG